MMRRRVSYRAASGLLTAGAIIAIAGCAGNATTNNAPDSSPSANTAAHAQSSASLRSLTRVDRLIARELKHPVKRIRDAAPPSIIDASLVERIAADDPLARLTLDEIAARFPLVTGDPPTDNSILERTRRSPALRAYLQGKRALRANNYETAIERLRVASQLTPNAIEPWIALGDAYAKIDKQIAASGSYKRVIAIEPTNAADRKSVV